MDETIVKRAKQYAAQQGTSVSRLVERFLSLLSRPAAEPGEEFHPILARLRGALRGASGDKTDYRRHLERKYR